MASIEISDKELESYTDGNILKVVASEWEVNHPQEDGVDAIAAMIKKSCTAIHDWIKDHGHPSLRQWKILSDQTGTKIINRYLSVIFNSNNKGKV